MSGQVAGIAEVSVMVNAELTVARIVRFTPGPAAQLAVFAYPDRVLVGGRVELSTQVVDSYGNNVADGTIVNFAVTSGQLDEAAAQTQAGVASTWLTAPEEAGSVQVVALSGFASDFTTVTVVLAPGEPAVVTLAAEPARIQLDGAPAIITATITDADGMFVSDGITVTFATELGNLAEVEVLTADGHAVTQLNPGVAIGTAHITARAGQAVGHLEVPILAGPAVTLTLTAYPDRVRTGGRVELSAQVVDRYGNHVADGTAVSFFAVRGQFDEDAAPTQAGVAVAWFTAPNEAGSVDILASSDIALDRKTLVVLGATYLPMIVR